MLINYFKKIKIECCRQLIKIYYHYNYEKNIQKERENYK